MDPASSKSKGNFEDEFSSKPDLRQHGPSKSSRRTRKRLQRLQGHGVPARYFL